MDADPQGLLLHPRDERVSVLSCGGFVASSRIARVHEPDQILFRENTVRASGNLLVKFVCLPDPTTPLDFLLRTLTGKTRFTGRLRKKRCTHSPEGNDVLRPISSNRYDQVSPDSGLVFLVT